MHKIQVYDRPMCCATGVCGPEVDPVLPRFAADLDWLRSQGHIVERFNLAQQPQAFIENQAIRQLLDQAGTNCLPVVLVNGVIRGQASYPSRDILASWVGASVKQPLPIANQSGGCCGTSGCC